MASQEDFLFAERALQRGYATEEQVQECLSLLERLREEMGIEETLANLLVKKGYLASAQSNVLEAEIGKDRAGRPKNAIEGYRLLERIGSGAMGSVYRADHLKLMIPVALKVLRPSLSSSRTQIERLKREAQLAARLSHPNVVRSLDVGESNGFHYLAMEFVEGETVRDLLDRGRVPEKEALRIVREVALGLAHAHAHGVIHRDVKPGNIMLSKGGTAKLGDFGLARGQGPSDLTLEHASIGTPQYVAPEQMRRGSDATPRSDLFSLGATLYHMVTGRPPFDGENLGEIVQNVLACRFAPPESLVPELSRDAVYVIDRLMRADPKERYAGAADLVADLDRIGRGEGAAPSDFQGDYQVFLARRRGRRNAILASCAVVLAVAGGLLLFRAHGEAKRQRLAETCRVLDGARADAESLARVADLRAAIVEMEKADADGANAGCRDGDVARLRARLALARKAREALAEAESIMEGSGEPDASYRELDRRLGKLDPPWEAARARIATLRDDLRRLSAAAAERRYTRCCTEGFLDLAAALREARAFAKDLETRYLELDAAWVREVAEAPRLLEDLERRWQAAVEDMRRRFQEWLDAGQYGRAASVLSDLRREEATALDPLAGSAFLKSLCSRLADADERLSTLTARETKEWNEILESVADRLEASEPRPDLAEDLLRKFRDRASVTREEVEAKRAYASSELEALRRKQADAFAAEDALCLRRLRQRLYMSAYEGAAGAARSGRWVAGIDERFRELRDRAQRMTELTARFLERVQGRKKLRIADEDFAFDRIEQAEGDDKDLFVARNAKRTVEFRLGDLDRGTLETILAFGKEDRFRRGWFYAAEAYKEDLRNPYAAQSLREAALLDLEATDPWAAEVSAELIATNQRILKGEARAQQAEADLTAARSAHDDVKALALVKELTELLWWTKHCEKRMADFLQQQKELERLAGRGLFLREMGVPNSQLEWGGRDVPGLPAKPTSITFTGRAWHPDEDKIPKDEPDRVARLEQLTREYWTEVFRAPGRADAEIAELVRRATRQLLPWGGPVEAAPEGGYRPYGAGLLADPQSWIEGREEPAAIHLAFPFRADRDWSIEIEVEWPADPGYFALSAGRIQAVVGYQRIPTRGGMAGVRLLVGEDLDPNAHLKELGDLHGHMANATTKDGKPARRPTESEDKRYLDQKNFVPGVPYRMRLERVDERIRFEMWPSGRDDKRVTLEKRDRREQLAKDVALADGRKVFRFFGIPGPKLGYVLRDVRITGILPERASEEAKQ